MSKEAMKLVPTKPTEEMLKAMDECSTEGYDERLYAGHAASVYMAAVDAAPTQPLRHEHAEQLAKLGWQYFECPACGSEGAKAFPKPAQQEPEWYHFVRYGEDCFVPYSGQAPEKATPLYTSPQRTWVGLADEEIEKLWDHGLYVHCSGITALRAITRAIEAKLKEKNT